MSRYLRPALLIIGGLIAQLYFVDGFRPWGVPANLIHVLALALVLVNRPVTGLSCAVIGSLVLDAASLGGLGLRAYCLSLAILYIYASRDLFGESGASRFLCLASALLLNQLLQLGGWSLAGLLDAGSAVVWATLAIAVGMDVLLAIPVLWAIELKI